MKKATINYYDNNALKLIKEYSNANMSYIYKIIEKYIQNNSNILDIGFGSGRDICHFASNNTNIWGIDASKVFVEIFKKKFPKLKNNVFKSTLPEININNIPRYFFDIVYSLATWMHIPKEEYSKVIINIKNVMKDNGVFILSYSYTHRDNDPRFFETINPKEIISLFEADGFILLESTEVNDSLSRKEIKWVTQVFQLKNR